MNTKYNPINETIIHEISVFRSAFEMAKTYTAGISHFHEPFRWIAGVVILYRELDPTRNNILSKEFLKGKAHWKWASVAPMPKYTETLRVSKELSIPVKDLSYNKRFVEIGNFLYDKIQEKLKENEAFPVIVKSRGIEK